MQADPPWLEIAARLGFAVLAGLLVGYNREARSQAAGLRTTTLVCVSACLSMVLADRLHAGMLARGDFSMDVLRLPLGVLTGIGFIGAGAIVRREDVVVGVTTAATLWFMTIVGLTMGAGELELGAAVTLIGLLALWGLKWADLSMHRVFRANLRVFAAPERLSEAELREIIDRSGHRVIAWGVTYRDAAASYEVHAELEWRSRTRARAHTPDFLQQLAGAAGVRQLDWSPRPVSA